MCNLQHRFLLLSLLTVIFGILDYYVCDFVVYVLKMPLFCDTIFCIAMTLFAGPVWGILVVLCDHIFDMIVSHSFVIYQLYMLSAMAGCITAWLFNKYVLKDEDSLFTKIAKLFLLVLIMCLVMSITGGVISRICAFVNGDGTEYTYQTQFLEVMFGGYLKSPLLDSIILRIPVNLADRLITVFAGFGVYKLMNKLLRQGA